MNQPHQHPNPLNVKACSDLTEKELSEIEGGILRSIAGGFFVHVALEAYNDWGAHRQAFNEGRAAVSPR